MPEKAKQTGRERGGGGSEGGGGGAFYDQMKQQGGEGRGLPSKLHCSQTRRGVGKGERGRTGCL